VQVVDSAEVGLDGLGGLEVEQEGLGLLMQ
jgi:hypothetical protein